MRSWVVEKVGSSRHVEWLNPSSNFKKSCITAFIEDKVVQAEVARNSG